MFFVLKKHALDYFSATDEKNETMKYLLEENAKFYINTIGSEDKSNEIEENEKVGTLTHWRDR